MKNEIKVKPQKTAVGCGMRRRDFLSSLPNTSSDDKMSLRLNKKNRNLLDERGCGKENNLSLRNGFLTYF